MLPFTNDSVSSAVFLNAVKVFVNEFCEEELEGFGNPTNPKYVVFLKKVFGERRLTNNNKETCSLRRRILVKINNQIGRRRKFIRN
jgi:hypothetical protein